ncbi:Na+/H+ antiporter NhaA [Planomonospora venezuelensis]|uniref:Na(+)/H(+) antiporter NhaA n=1 Tax=Planomonospora venezuelensis TaxID=1999 RepID=A0A841CXR9_PLAVE|nr:Na+/H+ antiporter NhaA [Planomonospora venezuelensis]MBB5961114.1 NhaA family Na+:H+ antiporter [Planomonospora venezuelensis]GIM99783.1 Na(+)/H(+) antiporter NhaA 3 [Planomonospora venezuelensis]
MRRAAELWPFQPTVRYARQLAEALRAETVGGVIMLLATVAALVWANVSHDSYEALRTTVVGPHALHLDLELYKWAQNGLLAIFFFVAGIEVKEEFVHGELANLRKAALPVLAAVAGMIMPALVYLAVSWGAPQAGRGWAVPTATDIAFALAVLAVTASALPAALRAFLLTSAVVDDLGAITIIAVFFTDHLNLLALAAGAAVIALYGLLQARRVRGAWIYVPLAVLAWYLVEISGVHATVAGVALGLMTRVHSGPGEESSPAERADHRLRPVSAGFAVPVFAFLSAGVVLDAGSLGAVAGDRVVLGVIAGLVAGKFLGVFGGAWLAVRLGLARLSEELHWRDMAAVSILAGVGFTVSLLIGGLAFGDDPERAAAVTTGVLAASLTASVLAAVLLRVRVRKHLNAQDDVVTRAR